MRTKKTHLRSERKNLAKCVCLVASSLQFTATASTPTASVLQLLPTNRAQTQVRARGEALTLARRNPSDKGPSPSRRPAANICRAMCVCGCVIMVVVVVLGGSVPVFGEHGRGLDEELALVVRVEGTGVGDIVEHILRVQPVPGDRRWWFVSPGVPLTGRALGA